MKPRRLNSIFLVIFALILSLSTSGSSLSISHAQDAEWSATLLFQTETGLMLQNVNTNGVIDTIPISDNMMVDDTTGSSFFITSPDSRFIIRSFYLQGDTSTHLRFGATGNGPCCTDMADLVGDVSAYSLAGFELDGSRFAVAYVSRNVENSSTEGGIMVIDAATNEIVASSSMQELIAGTSIPPDDWAQMGRWTAEGIHFIGNCFGCGGGYLEGHYSLWNPDTNTIIPDTGIAVSDFGVVLEGTGEFIYRGQDTNFYYDPTPGVYVIPNVIQYFPNGDLAQTPVPIYTQPDSTNLGGISWVGDGQAVLANASSGDYWDIIFRSGRIERIQDTPQPRFMGATPDGWFASTSIDGIQTIVHYNIDTLGPSVVTQFSEGTISAQFTYFPPLGENVAVDPFVAITPPDVAQTARCPNSLPARLIAGQSARVLSGAPNRIREYPSVDAPVVGEIPADATFSVVSGPSCDGTSITWWYIDYDGTSGWTAEGEGDTYFTEPLE